MKAVMYHYVREYDERLPYFTYLHREDFIQQMEWLRCNFGFCQKENFLEWLNKPHLKKQPNGVLLTFDDGFIDHYTTVAPILDDFGTWGIFYVPTGIYTHLDFLDVHIIHLLIGKLGGQKCLELLGNESVSEMFPDAKRKEFHANTYTRQHSSDDITKHFKRMTNYFVDYKWRARLLERLLAVGMGAIESKHWKTSFYLNPKMISDLCRAGHMIGSHSISHRVMSKLTLSEQRIEIFDSVKTLANIAGEEVNTFCYPYGGFHSFTDATENLLLDAGMRFTFNVEQRDILDRDIINRPQALPRYDCNQFPHGQASIGKVRPQ